ncbi:hypothetical protein QYE76_020899 [Lolium multiflorum]|uniref:Zinc finger, CCHC-type n=1 Tax=Lolium multiflorum TaxID=4521 RepID=A0AAD8R6R7_LOLMU|nr:hypothetical protein QYE76_020899 [Lolium multiflorum]
MLVMTGHAKKLSDLGIVIPNRLGINRVLQSLPPSYKNFVMNYNMQNMNKEFPELFGMLKAAEIEIKKEHQVLMVNKTTSFKKQGKSKGKNKKSGKKAATPPVKPKSGPKPMLSAIKEKGHWKRNCSKYLADLKSGLIKKKKEGRRLGLLAVHQIWRDLFLDVSLAFVVVHDGAGAGARWFFWSEDDGPEVVVMSFFFDFIDGRRRILVQDSTGTSLGRRATTCASLLACSSTHKASLAMVLFGSCNGGGSASLLAFVSAALELDGAGYGGCRKP